MSPTAKSVVCLFPLLSSQIFIQPFSFRPDSLPDPFITLSRQSHANLLNDLYNDDQDRHCHQHNVFLIAVIAVVDGNTAQSAAADRACHGRIAEYGGGGDSRSDQKETALTPEAIPSR